MRNFLAKIASRFSPSAKKASLKAAMKEDWNRRARDNAMHFIADFEENWSGREEEFFLTGRHDVEKCLAQLNIEIQPGQKLLEIGCGIGRMTRHFAELFDEVWGLDVSDEMIRRAAQCVRKENVRFIVNDGTSLADLPGDYFDLAFSFVVFQHFPLEEFAYEYVSETWKKLKAGGAFYFQARTDFAHKKTDTYRGASIHIRKFTRFSKRLGFTIERIINPNSQYTWFILKKHC